MEPLEFELNSNQYAMDSGALCLDLVNTLDWRTSPDPKDDLTSYAAVVEWAIEAHLLSVEEGRLLLEQTGDALTQRILQDAVRLREGIYHIFAALMNEQAVAYEDLDILTEFWRKAAQYRQIDWQDGKPLWAWQLSKDDPERMLWPAVQSAVDLLESGQAQHVGQCQDDRGCGFVFLDTSRNHSRRWCSMESCGNRAKANRHYTRNKK